MGINKSGRRPTKLGKRGKGRITMVALNNTASLNEIRIVYCRSKTSVWRAQKANCKSIHQVGKDEEVSHFNSRSLVMDSGMG
uniref:Transposase n=1 Tax=Heterorhabditis bacteriophora TaxID=37862 RepID=A0A1I7XAI3_HETBA